ncbi:uncharacterized protein LOC116301746 [Actinia tenebrosa]|uniref:Large ribosomal subunit protein bL17m n=1 Tax=Actinia tenebrosa TaxID=6105 RepID=A0A6P8IJU9_ACTTE|nr:uncharacterized protein LOC116301746 [Actinia tenebrosa]
MASSMFRRVCCSSAIKAINSGLNLTTVRLGTHRKFPTKKVVNPFVQRRTDFIKKLVLALVQFERVQTTLMRAKELKKYSDLLITLSQRRSPPPDLDMIQQGFILNEAEALENMITKRIINRRSKKVIIQPKELSEEEFVARCREEASNILMGNKDALVKLYGPLKERYEDRYGGFTRIIKILSPTKSPYPQMAYVELIDNDLEPLPDFPVIKEGKITVYGSNSESDSESSEVIAVGH